VNVPKYRPVREEEPASPHASQAAMKGARPVHLSGAAPVEAVIYERDRLDIGTRILGPAIVEQFDATTVVPPGWSGTVDRYHNLILRGRIDAQGTAPD
jgi:N-methylhydantoinase A